MGGDNNAGTDMKIALLGKSFNTGGAGIAAGRLLEALKKQGADVEGIASRGVFWFIIEKIIFLFYARSLEVLFDFSLALFGQRVKPNGEIVHLHWINGGFLSLRRIRRLTKKYRVFWTLHDMWPVTGGCHCPIECDSYLTGCGGCQCLRKPGPRDLSKKRWRRKFKTFLRSGVTIIAPSRWMAEIIRRAPMFGNKIYVIPNCIDTEIFRPHNESEPKTIIFGAYNVLHGRKGLGYLSEALHYTDLDTKVIIFGKNSERVWLPRETERYPLIQDNELVGLYNRASVCVAPSTYDNLPSVVLEAMACGVPVVAFRTGGIPEMIDHKVNGYLVEPLDVMGLADGIRFAMKHAREMGNNARRKVMNNYTPEIIAKKHMETYEKTW